MLGWLVFRIIVLPQKERHGKGITMLSTIFAFGIAIPFVILEPVGLIWFLDIRHVGLRMTLLAMPIVNSLRISEGEKIKEVVVCPRSILNLEKNLLTHIFSGYIGQHTLVSPPKHAKRICIIF